MHTYFLGAEEVDAYLREFEGRLRDLGEKKPSVWCPVGPSGQALAERLGVLAAAEGEDVRILNVSFDRDKGKVTFQGEDPASDLRGQRVLVLDSAVHGGATMQRVAQEIYSYGVAGICTYGLVVKKGTRFVPSFWALLIEDHDRAYFLLDKIPTERLSKRDPYFHLRRLQEKDLSLAPVASKLSSLNRITWNDRFFEVASSDGNKSCYLLEVGSEVVGYLTVELKKDGRLTIHEVAVDSAHEGKNFGGALMRWAETIARHSQRAEIELWAIENQVKFYQHFGYKQIPERKIALDDGEAYFLMKKATLHHI